MPLQHSSIKLLSIIEKFLAVPDLFRFIQPVNKSEILDTLVLIICQSEFTNPPNFWQDFHTLPVCYCNIVM